MLNYLSVLIFGKEKNRKKPLMRRGDQLRQLNSQETQVKILTGLNIFSVVRGNSLTACAMHTRAYLNCIQKFKNYPEINYQDVILTEKIEWGTLCKSGNFV